MTVLKALFGWLLNRWVLSALGLLFVALLVWFVGPLIAIAGAEPLAGPMARMVAIMVVVVGWAVWTVTVAVGRQRTNTAVLTNIAAAPAAAGEARPDASAEEVAALKQRFGEAVATLKKARLGGGAFGARRYLYQLPWYVIIGPPGAGKTTALRNSGVKFPLMDQFGKDAIRGVGGTRNCDWWFTEEAVILDTAGRYTTQDSDELVDSAAWSGFLTLLKRYRRRRPIDGVMVAFSLADITRQNPMERAQHARAVRQRLTELTDNLKVRVPVYVLFTKTDLMNGFIEFFDDLGRDDRAQVWGTTFTIGQSEQPGAAVAAFGDAFDGLVDRLGGRLMARLYQERDVHRRGAIQGFPQQMASLKATLGEFLSEVFAASHYETSGMLRGVYFTSGTQEGTPIDRVIGAVSAGFGLEREAAPPYSGQGRSYFLTRLLREVVFREAELVGHTGLLARYRGWLERGAYVGAAALGVLTIGLWINSFFLNRAYIAQVEADIAGYDQVAQDLVDGRGSLLEILPYLNELRDIPGGYADRDTGGPILAGFGLGQTGKLGAAGQGAYQRALNGVLLPRVVERLEEQLGQAPDDPDLLFEALKVYLMLGTPSRFDRDEVTTWITTDWASRLPGEANREPREDLIGHLTALAAGERTAFNLNPSAVRQARDRLQRESLAQRVYGSLKRANLRTAVPDWTLTDKIGEAQARVFERTSGAPLSRGLSGLFTRAGYAEVLLAELPGAVDVAAREAWVLGKEYAERLDRADLRQLRGEITRLYAEDYKRQWETFLADFVIRPFPTFADGARTVTALASQDSAIRNFALAVARDTKLTGAPFVGAGDATLGGQVQSRVSQLLQRSGSASEGVADPAAVVDQRFADLHVALAAGSQGAAPIDAALEPLNDLYAYLAGIDASSTSGDAAVAAAGGGQEGRAVMRRVQLAADGQPEPIERWLDEVVNRSASLVLRDIRARVNDIWAANLLPYCRQAIAARYPMAKASPNDVNLSDFARFFGPQGMVDGFFNQYLAPFVDTSVQPWRQLTTGGVTLGLSADALAQFERADRVKQAFFAGGQGEPVVQFQMRPLFLDRGASQVRIQLAGNPPLTYRHGPVRWVSVNWPGGGDTDRALVSFTSVSTDRTSSLTADGPWSWFRLLDQAQLDTIANTDRFQVTFQIEGLKAVYELRASSVANPFRMASLSQFQCAEQL